jgi:hypothetical protein
VIHLLHHGLEQISRGQGKEPSVPCRSPRSGSQPRKHVMTCCARLSKNKFSATRTVRRRGIAAKKLKPPLTIVRRFRTILARQVKTLNIVQSSHGNSLINCFLCLFIGHRSKTYTLARNDLRSAAPNCAFAGQEFGRVLYGFHGVTFSRPRDRRFAPVLLARVEHDPASSVFVPDRVDHVPRGGYGRRRSRRTPPCHGPSVSAASGDGGERSDRQEARFPST